MAIEKPENLENASLRAIERLTDLLAFSIVKNEQPAAQIELLTRFGFANTHIARVLGMKANAVNVAIHRLKKKGAET